MDDRHGAGQVEVLIHGGGELGRQGPGSHLLGGGVDGVGVLAVAELVGPQDRAGQSLPQGCGVGQGLLGELHGGAVVDGAQGQAQHGGVVALEQLGHHQGVAQRLAHLLALDGHPGVVDPVAREAPAGAVGLGLLVLVVGETQVDAAAVDVEGLAQVAARHGRALQVPARPAPTPGGVPGGVGRLGGLGGLPQGEVTRVALVGLDVVIELGLVLGGGQVLQTLVGQGAVAGQGAHVVVDVAGLSDVGVAGVQQALYQVDHLGDVACGARLVGGGGHPQGAVGGVELPLEALGPGPPRHRRLGGGGLAEDLVVDVGDVADEADLLAAALEPAAQDVEGDAAAHVADVGRALDGGTTQVDRHQAGGGRGGQRHDGAGGGVVHTQGRRVRSGGGVGGARGLRGLSGGDAHRHRLPGRPPPVSTRTRTFSRGARRRVRTLCRAFEG